MKRLGMIEIEEQGMEINKMSQKLFVCDKICKLNFK